MRRRKPSLVGKGSRDEGGAQVFKRLSLSSLQDPVKLDRMRRQDPLVMLEAAFVTAALRRFGSEGSHRANVRHHLLCTFRSSTLRCGRGARKVPQKAPRDGTHGHLHTRLG